MNVLIIPEDPVRDQYILQPLFQRLFADLRQAPTKVSVCQNPRLRDIQDAMDIPRLRDILLRYPMVDIFILCVDRDGNKTRKRRLDRIEKELAGKSVFIAENAWEEVETWTLAGLKLSRDWAWSAVRSEISVKERYFEPLAKRMGVFDGPGDGRKEMGAMAARNIRAIRRKCPEDFGHLATRLQEKIAAP